MCKKLILVLAMLAIVSPALAFNPGDTFTDPGDQVYGTYGADGDNVILKVDINANGNSTYADTQDGWIPWEMDGYWGPIGAQSKNFGFGSYMPFITIDGITHTGGAGQFGGSRDRLDGVDGEQANDFANVLADLVYVPHTAAGMGKDYIKVTINYGPTMANVNLNVTMLGWDPAFAGNGLPGYGGAGEQEGSKQAAWSTTNPSTWLSANLPGEPNGYGYHSTVGESNMPAGLQALVGDQAIMLGTAPWLSMFDGAIGMTFASTVNVTLDENGVIDLYGWAEMLSQSGSQHIALNGIVISLPEPATIALLGLGGLALIRRKR
jgi:hypothetical protein